MTKCNIVTLSDYKKTAYPLPPIIVGFQKCGQHSLVKYLERLGYKDILRAENIHADKGMYRFLNEYLHTHQVHIIIRDRPSAIWSRYWYMKANRHWSYEKYLTITDHRWSPLYHTDFSYHIDAWSEFNPVIWNLEELRQLPNFPHEYKNPSLPKMTKHDLDLTLAAIQLYKRGDII